MKKAVPTLLALGGTLIFAYVTRPKLETPILQTELPAPARNKKALESTSNSLPQSSLMKKSPKFTMGLDKTWHDAMASDVPREIERDYHSMPEGGPFGHPHWQALDQNLILPKTSASRAEKSRNGAGGSSSKRRYFQNTRSNHKGRTGHSRLSLNSSSRKNGSRPFDHRAGKPSQMDKGKRLLTNWVHSGRITRSRGQRAPQKMRAHHSSRKDENSGLAIDPLGKAFRLARKKARLSSRRLKALKRKANRLKSSHKKKPMGKALIARLLGQKSIRSPQIKTDAPPNPWNHEIAPLPNGQAPPSQSLNDEDVSSVSPPSLSKRTKSAKVLSDGHATYYKQGSQWGVLSQGRWGYIVRNHKTSFLYSSPAAAPLARHEGHWWIKKNGAFLLYHQGQALGAEEMSQWAQEHPNAKPAVQYSSDLKRMAIGSRDQTAFFNLETGEKINPNSSPQ